MRTIRFSAILLVLISPAARPQALGTAERDRAATELEASRRAFREALNGLTDAQWRFKPAPERWSIAECVEHVALAEDFYYDTITGKLVPSPAAPEKRAEVAGKDDLVLKVMPDRSSKRVTSPALEPKGRWTPAQALAHFEKSRDRLLAYVRGTADPLRDHFQSHRATGLIDGYQWILLASGHVRRHLAQIEEVKAQPGYPGK